MHHMDKPTKRSLHWVVRCGLKGQHSEIQVLYQRNRTSWVCINIQGEKTTAKKVHEILTLTLPIGVKDLHRFFGMVQYYRDLWARCSKMLAPLNSLVGECGPIKVTRAKKTKNVPWDWD